MGREADNAIQDALRGKKTFCKFLSANDTGETGGHQAGIYISKPSIGILFDEPGVRGENKERRVKVTWQNDLITDTRFIYYGQGTRNEYRITNFGHGFPYLKPAYTGALFVFVEMDQETYRGYILNTEEDINAFLDAFGLSPVETNALIDTAAAELEQKEQKAVNDFVRSLITDFPDSYEMSRKAREIQNAVYDHEEDAVDDPDRKLLDWSSMEYNLFRCFEDYHYQDKLKGGFTSVSEFVEIANQILNRRKSRAGKSLEHHLAALFDVNNIEYSAQAVTEGNKKPDFLFPSSEAYHDMSFSVDKLLFLAAKTTCKDRWRQIITECDRLSGSCKYLCTLQQGISAAQMDEMASEKVILVVPKPYIKDYPLDRQNRIWTVRQFISYVKSVEEK
jgi:hypothetical protein